MINIVIFPLSSNVNSTTRFSTGKTSSVPILIQRSHAIVVSNAATALCTRDAGLYLSLQQPEMLLAVQAAISSAVHVVCQLDSARRAHQAGVMVWCVFDGDAAFENVGAASDTSVHIEGVRGHADTQSRRNRRW